MKYLNSHYSFIDFVSHSFEEGLSRLDYHLPVLAIRSGYAQLLTVDCLFLKEISSRCQNLKRNIFTDYVQKQIHHHYYCFNSELQFYLLASTKFVTIGYCEED